MAVVAPVTMDSSLLAQILPQAPEGPTRWRVFPISDNYLYHR